MSDQVTRRANKALDKVNKIVREMTAWQGKRPTRIRVNHGDYLALVEKNYIRDGKLSGTQLEVEPG